MLLKKVTPFQIIILGFIGVILAGTVLLSLPVSSASPGHASVGDALFTATSAVCVTGLVVQDTASYWSYFGQAVILILIQIGGLGIISVVSSLAFVSGRKISLMQRTTLQNAISAQQVGGVVHLTKFVVRMSFAIEAIGAVLILPTFFRRYGLNGIWKAVFHSVSAFCNAGFDVMGDRTGKFSSITSFDSNVNINVVICMLIIVGGIGFLTWDDIVTKRHHILRYRMQSKVILVTTAVLITVPFLYFFFTEYSGMPMKERTFVSIFQAVTPRTAGFNTADLTALSGPGRIVVIALMLVGGSPGSTAGGMKTTTLAVLVANAFSIFRQKKCVKMFGRRIEDSVIRSAATIFTLYLTLSVLAAAVISFVEKLPTGVCFFETASAIGTVGLTLGITPSLGQLSRLIIIVLMFMGRVGGLTVIYAASFHKVSDVSQYPIEKITVG